MLIQATWGSETGHKATETRKPEETRSRRQETAGAKQTGESQISQTETAGRRSSKTAGAIRKKRGDPGDRRWKEQWPKKTGGHPTFTDGDRRGVRQRWAVKEIYLADSKLNISR